MPSFPSFANNNAANKQQQQQHQQQHTPVEADSDSITTEQSAIANLEERLREEIRLMMESTNKRLQALEMRVENLETSTESTSSAASSVPSNNSSTTTTKSLEERVATLEGILKKAEEAGKRRMRRSGSSDGTPTPTSPVQGTLSRSRSRSKMTSTSDNADAPCTSSVGSPCRSFSRSRLSRSDSGKMPSMRKINPDHTNDDDDEGEGDDKPPLPGLSRTLSARGLRRSDSGKLPADMRVTLNSKHDGRSDNVDAAGNSVN
uniref:Uncharacterized protein n=1 Tax=Amphora coffeiformis TaxID=265554 RepID=A0A7S3KXV1_9STRA